MADRHDADQADFRTEYASQQENTGPAGHRAELVASRAARAMRDGDRHMDGSLRDHLAATRRAYDDRTARLGPATPDYWGVWGSAERDWEAEAG